MCGGVWYAAPFNVIDLFVCVVLPRRDLSPTISYHHISKRMSSQPYNGEEKLVFAIDCGTTMSAVSFTHLLRGVVPQVRVVSRWPYQEEATGNCKFPTVVRYDSSGTAISFGAEALENETAVENTCLVRWFKLHLHPKEMRDENAITVPALPPRVTLSVVYRDFLRYAFNHASEFFKSSTLDGQALWERLGRSFEIVFAIPNGWNNTQQNFIQDAAVAAGILPANFARQRLFFVSEAEASVHFAVEHMNVAHSMQIGTVFAVLDAGGSTVDTTIYRCETVAPKLRLVEVTSSECVQAGSVFVDRTFENSIRTLLAGSRFGTNDYVEDMIRVFEGKTKRRFTGSDEQVIVQFGRNSDNDRPRGIKMGRLTVPSKVVCDAFQPSVTAITASVCRALARTSQPCKTFLLVGGFAESPYLRNALQEALEYRGVQFVFSDEPTTKAAAEGACSWHVKQYVTARAARNSYGMHIYRIYDSTNPIHIGRVDQIFVDAAGDIGLSGFLDVLVKKNEIVQAHQAISRPYFNLYDLEPSDLGNKTIDLLVSDAENPGPWAVDTEGQYTPGVRYACTLRADLSGLKGHVKKCTNGAGKTYYKVEFNVEVYFGGTSLTAAITWIENGITKRGDVGVIPNSVA